MTDPRPPAQALAFIGGGNMASAIIGGLRRQGVAGQSIQVVEPLAEQRERLRSQWDVHVLAHADASLARAELVVWAVKPQACAQAAQQAGPHTAGALHLSVAAGITTDSMAAWLGSQRIVRAMPNTPALVGRGITGLFARPAVSVQEKQSIETIIATTGQWVWLQAEEQLDAVTALSGSGPAYVFHLVECLAKAGEAEGLPPDLAMRLARATVEGAGELLHRSDLSAEMLRQNVTSPGGTTAAGLTVLMGNGALENLIAGTVHAARRRAAELSG